MQIPKLKVLIEAGAVRSVEAIPDGDGWAVWVTYARRGGGTRVFATLEAVARCLAGAGLPAFRVHVAGPTGEEPP